MGLRATALHGQHSTADHVAAIGVIPTACARKARGSNALSHILISTNYSLCLSLSTSSLAQQAATHDAPTILIDDFL